MVEEVKDLNVQNMVGGVPDMFADRHKRSF